MEGRPNPEPADGIASNGIARESVWSYPRPPRVEPCPRRVRVLLAGETVAESTSAVRVLETAGAPVIYVPPADVRADALRETGATSFCEWKGVASYFDIVVEEGMIERAAWAYPDPTPSFVSITDYLSFYPARLECYLDDERVEPQPGMFYGGWVTAEITGPIKGGPGSERW